MLNILVKKTRDFPGGTQAQSPVGELRSHKLQGIPKKKRKKKIMLKKNEKKKFSLLPLQQFIYIVPGRKGDFKTFNQK